MERKERLVLFTKMLNDDYYFKKSSNKNRWEWLYNSDSHIVIYGDDPMEISGVDNIGAYASALDLCCYVEFSFRTRRVEIHVH